MISEHHMNQILKLSKKWLDDNYDINETEQISLHATNFNDQPNSVRLELIIHIDPVVYGMRIASIEPAFQMVDERGNFQTLPPNVVNVPMNIQRLINDYADGDTRGALKLSRFNDKQTVTITVEVYPR